MDRDHQQVSIFVRSKYCKKKGAARTHKLFEELAPEGTIVKVCRAVW